MPSGETNLKVKRIDNLEIILHANYSISISSIRVLTNPDGIEEEREGVAYLTKEEGFELANFILARDKEQTPEEKFLAQRLKYEKRDYYSRKRY